VYCKCGYYPVIYGIIFDDVEKLEGFLPMDFFGIIKFDLHVESGSKPLLK
jgi:hypothetical protein